MRSGREHPVQPREHVQRYAYVDVLRGIAILAVMVHHLPDDLSGVFGRLAYFGGRGVDLFFVLSGFLIGSTVLARAGSGAPSVDQARAYWVLRTVRIWPLYFLLLAIYAIGLPLIHPDVTSVIRHYPLPYLIFTSNDLGQATLELGIFWSLAIEEQFYLAVGLLVLACARRREVLAGAFVGMALTAIAVALRTRLELKSLHAAGLFAESTFVFKYYFSTLSRMDQLALGLLCAVVAPACNQTRWFQDPRAARATTWLAISALVVGMLTFKTTSVFEFAVLGLIFAGGVLVTQRPAARQAARNRIEQVPMRFLTAAGKLSFGLYLLHPVARWWTQKVMGRVAIPEIHLKAIAFLVLWLLVTWVLAAISYRLLESPLLKRARRRADEMVGLGRTRAAGASTRAA